MQSMRIIIACCVIACCGSNSYSQGNLSFNLRYQTETSKNSGRYHRLQRKEEWSSKETAIIVCDVWDLHDCLNAVRREGEFAPRLNQLLTKARNQGVTIIHSPSSCMEFYKDHPARKRAIDAPAAKSLPKDIVSWCHRIPAEERGKYPLDQSDGGNDDDPVERKQWLAKLKSMGRNVRAPWKSQLNVISINKDKDYISDRGDEVWNIMEQRGIKNVILTGVHTNMCVLGRPFGLRQMARNGKNVVLVRDMTDTMYNPQSWPFVSHFSGTDLIISHIEKFVCPTITSDQILGGKPFRFKNDKRPHLVIVMGEKEYHTNETLPKLAADALHRDFRVSYVFADDEKRNEFPGWNVVNEADVLLLSVRRRLLSMTMMKQLRNYIKSGKPVIGIRTSSHAFALRNKPAPAGLSDWPDFDWDVFGCRYDGHYNDDAPQVKIDRVKENLDHTIIKSVSSGKFPFPPGYHLYKFSHLHKKATLLLQASVGKEGIQVPVTWTYIRPDGGRSFYSSLGHPNEFKNPVFSSMLVASIYWAVNSKPSKKTASKTLNSFENEWTLISVPVNWKKVTGGDLNKVRGQGWYRCVLRLSKDWLVSNNLKLHMPVTGRRANVWFNGHRLKHQDDTYVIPNDWVDVDDSNLLVVSMVNKGHGSGIVESPQLISGSQKLNLKGLWQFRIGHDEKWQEMRLPPKFGTSTDIIFEP